MKKIFVKKIALMLASLLIFLQIPVSRAQENPLPLPCETYPCSKILEITAYYSPLPFQTEYFTGSYESDLTLNGRGINGADGTKVFPGMLAAPKNYPFGTVIEIPDVGFTTVHDRGGAIREAGSERGNQYDRADLWAGYGDSGLKRAKIWGRRVIEVTIHGPESTIEPQVNFEGLENETVRPVTPETALKHAYSYSYFQSDLSFGMQNSKVTELQYYLNIFGLLGTHAPGIYDAATMEAVKNFQLQNKVIGNENEFGVGNFGPKTREQFENAINGYQKNKFTFLEKNLGKDDSGEAVKTLQKHLISLNYLNQTSTSGIYDQDTVNAIYNFQMANNIVKTESDPGAGYFGPKTREQLKKNIQGIDFKINPSQKNSSSSANETSVLLASEISLSKAEIGAVLKLGDRGDQVRLLQEELTRLGFFSAQPSGFYGQITEHAVYKFQQSQKIVSLKSDQGAGVLGPQTSEILNNIIAARIRSNQMIAANSNNSRLVAAAGQ